MGFIYTSSEEVRNNLKAQGLTELKSVNLNKKIHYCFVNKNGVEINFSKDEIVYSNQLFL
ncbi:hypothetical protein N2W52_002109 [Clostridium perfringens]|nr:hypothetical protein [Clostridium perfringens]MDK0982893.1 hypothetical protein [Clostridium perfringens]